MKPLCRYIQQLLDFPENRIVIAKENFVMTDLSGEYIVVYELSSNEKGRMLSYDYENDQDYYNIYMSSRCEILFYGNPAKENAYKFSALHSSQESYELQGQLGLAVYRPTIPTHPRSQDGTQYHELWSVEIVCDYTFIQYVETANIEEAQIEIIED